MIGKLLKAHGAYLKAQYEASAAVGHNLEKGEWRETFIRNWLSEILPEKYGVTSGIVFSAADDDNSSSQSRQQDIIIYDRVNCPRLFVNATQADLPKCIPIESVYCTIEVKSQLDSVELKRALTNFSSVRKLQKHPLGFVDSLIKGGITPPAGFIFAFTTTISFDKIADILREERLRNVDCHVQGVIVLGADSGEGGIVSYRSNNNVNVIEIEPSAQQVVEVYGTRAFDEVMLLFMSLLINTLNYTIIQRPDMNYYINTSRLNESAEGWIIPFKSINEYTRIINEDGFCQNIFGSKELDMDHRIVDRAKSLLAEGKGVFCDDEFAQLAFAHLFLAVRERNVVPEFGEVFKGFSGNIMDKVERIAYEKDISLTEAELKKFRCQYISSLNRIRVKYNPQMLEPQKKLLLMEVEHLEKGIDVDKILKVYMDFEILTAKCDISRYIDETELDKLFLISKKQ